MSCFCSRTSACSRAISAVGSCAEALPGAAPAPAGARSPSAKTIEDDSMISSFMDVLLQKARTREVVKTLSEMCGRPPYSPL